MDLTNQREMPHIRFTGKVRLLTAEECAEQARECRRQLGLVLTARTRREVTRELRGWERLASEREVAERRAKVVKLCKRIENVHSDRMWETGQRLISREWAAIEAIVGRRVLSVPNDPEEPLRLGAPVSERGEKVA